MDSIKTEQQTLSIRLSADGFSFSLFSPVSEGGHHITPYQVDEARSLTANLKQCFRETEWLNHTYRRVNILIAGRRFTTLPLEFFEDEQAEEIFYHNHPKRENELVLYNILQRHNVVVVYGMDRSAHTYLSELCPAARFFAQASPLIEFFGSKSRLGNNRKLYAHLRKGATDVYSFERSRLLLANTFPTATTADRLYHLLYIWKQLEFDQERDELHLSGELTEKERLLAELRKYIRQVFIMNPAAHPDFQAITSCE